MPLTLLLAVLAPVITGQPPADTTGCRVTDIAGRYRQGASSVLIVEHRSDGLVARPILWGAFQPLQPVGTDSFVVADRPERTLRFTRDVRGCLNGVVVSKLELDGLAPLLPVGAITPIERLLSGQARSALRAFRTEGLHTDDALVQVAARVLARVPSRASAVAAFLNALQEERPLSAPGLATLAEASMAIGRRSEARALFERALALDPSNADVTVGVRRLRDGDRQERLPYSLAQLLKPPADSERVQVRAAWELRSHAVVNAAVEARERIAIGTDSATVLVVSHGASGARRVGAIIVPAAPTPDCCAVLVDIKGVAWNYPPLAVPRDVQSPAMLGPLARQVIVVVPGIRGEVLRVGQSTWTSDGDRTDGFDGGADDALDLLEVALRVIPQADSSRVCVFGHSRGGGAALLAAERSRRLKCVVAMAGPTDWFALMPGSATGWTTAEVVAEGLRRNATPDQEGGQFIERFLVPSINGIEDLRDARLRLLRSSPLYFADRLPHAQLHYGLEDPSVPAVNGRALLAACRAARRDCTAYFYANAGHDTDRPAAFANARRFLKVHLRLHP